MWESPTPNIIEPGGQFIEVTTEWRRAWFTNVPEELCDQLIPETFKYPDPELN